MSLIPASEHLMFCSNIICKHFQSFTIAIYVCTCMSKYNTNVHIIEHVNGIFNLLFKSTRYRLYSNVGASTLNQHFDQSGNTDGNYLYLLYIVRKTNQWTAAHKHFKVITVMHINTLIYLRGAYITN